MIWSDMRAEILRALKEPATNTGHWSYDDLLRRANIMQRRIVTDTECMQIVDTSNTSVASQQEYALPSGLIRICRVLYGNTRLNGINEAEIDMRASMGSIDHPWQGVTGDPSAGGRYYQNRTTFGIVPCPSNSGDTISVEYIPTPADMVNDTDIPFNGLTDLYHVHDTIISGVLYRCLLEDKNQFYSEYKTEYEKGMSRLKIQMKNRPDTWAQTVMLGKRNRFGRTPLDFYRMG